MEDTTDTDYMHAKRVCKDFEIKILVDTMICIFKIIHFLAVFENFREMVLKMYHLYPAKLISALRLACQAALKMT